MSHLVSNPRPQVQVINPAGLPTDEIRRLVGDRVDVVGDTPKSAAPAISSSLLGELLNAVGEGVCIADGSGKFAWCNDLVTKLSAALRERLAEVCREGHAWFANPPKSGRLSSASRPSRTYEIQDGVSSFVVVVSALPPSTEGGDRFVAAVIRDVSDQQRMQQKIDAIDQAGRELLRIDADTLRSSNAMERLKMIESRIIKGARELLHFDHFAIRILDEKTGKLELVMSHGLPAEAAELEIFAKEENNGIAGYVAATGKGYVCPDAQCDNRFLALVGGARSSLVVPLRLAERTLGVFDVESLTPGAFNDDDLQFTRIFGRYIAMALNMLDLLVIERSATNMTVTGQVEGEIREPLEDITKEISALREGETDPETVRHLDRVLADVDSIRSRMRACAQGPQRLLGIEAAMQDKRRDPIIAGRRILVADDAGQIRRIIHDVLHTRGADVGVVDNGGDAINMIERAAADGRPYELVVSDIKMPDRNGYEVFAAARRANTTTAVVLMTGFGYDPHHSIVRASQEGLQCVLFKPFQVERLLDEVRKALAAMPSTGA